MGLWRMEYSHCSSRSAFKALRRDSRSAVGLAANNDAVRNGVSARQMRERSIEPPAGFRRDHLRKGDQGQRRKRRGYRLSRRSKRQLGGFETLIQIAQQLCVVM